MYFNALYFGLFDAPSRNENIRKYLEEKTKKEGNIVLYKELENIDPETAKSISPNDKRRIIRALEVYYVTGKPTSTLKNYNKKLPLNWLLVCLSLDRKIIYEKINKRVDKMIEEGLIEETKNIIEKYGENAYALGSIGYKEIKEYLLGKTTLEEAKEQIKKATRNYAKRQITWFKKIPNTNFISSDNIQKIEKLILDFLQNN